MSELEVLTPEQRVYALAVREAELEYRTTVTAAMKVRNDKIRLALETCELAMKGREDDKT